ncbi:MAG: 23S rRNA (adenine(1618)-N(6))-methyltransferase RlmF [Neptuniibacter sp.]
MPNQQKPKLHPRNPHNSQYDLEHLAATTPELKPFLIESVKGGLTVDFSQPQAVKALNKALLQDVYGVDFWDIPEGALCPAVPGRADYIHYLADLLAVDNGGEVPKGGLVRGLDIGMGASCVYPIIGSQAYGWSFVGSDINPVSVSMVEQIVQFNAPIKKKIRCRLQKNEQQIFKGVISENDLFHFTLCNPPFHASLDEATQGTQRKINNLNRSKGRRGSEAAKAAKGSNGTTLNFAGQGAELWCPGGELAFIQNMIKESEAFKQQCLWFTCLVSKKENLKALQKALRKTSACEVKVIEMAQGQKQSRFIAWSYFSSDQRENWYSDK